MTLLREEKFIGCLLGGAIGDALGMPLIGMTRVEIAALGEILDFQRSERTYIVNVPVGELGDSELGDPLEAGQWTDDTQLTLALAETLIEEGGLFVPEAWAHKLARWVNNEPRGPGLSSLQAAIELRTGGLLWDEAADPEGAGCGTATRVAPVGLLYWDDPTKRRYVSICQAQVTHGDRDAHAASLAVAEAVAIATMTQPDSLKDWNGTQFLRTIIERVLVADEEYLEFANCLKLAETLLMDEVDAETAIRVLGVSGWSREAVPCALYIVARFAPDFEEMLLAAVNLTGGSVESIACICGAIGGALHGVEAIPMRWRTGVEDGERIVQTASALCGIISEP